MATVDSMRGSQPRVALTLLSPEHRATWERRFEAAHREEYDSGKCNALMNEFLNAFNNSESTYGRGIKNNDLSKYLGDGTTATSQHFWRMLGSNNTRFNEYQNMNFLRTFSVTQLPPFIEGLRENKNPDVIGCWSSDDYALTVIEEAMKRNYPETEDLLPFLEKNKMEIEEALAQVARPVPSGRFDRKNYAAREKEMLAAKGLLSPAVYEKLVQEKFIIWPTYSTHRWLHEITLQGEKEDIEERVRKMVFQEMSSGDSSFDQLIDDRKSNWMQIWLEKLRKKEFKSIDIRRDIPTENLVGVVALKITAEQVTACQTNAANGTDLVIRARTAMVNEACRQIFDIIQKS